MQIVYQAQNLSDAEDVRDVLASSGIVAYLGEPNGNPGPTAGFIRISVDNIRVDAARRVIALWSRDRKLQLL